MTTTTITVNGMTCGHCVGAVTAEIEKVAGVSAVAVELASGVVTIESAAPLAEAELAAAVEEAGYEVRAS